MKKCGKGNALALLEFYWLFLKLLNCGCVRALNEKKHICWCLYIFSVGKHIGCRSWMALLWHEWMGCLYCCSSVKYNGWFDLVLSLQSEALSSVFPSPFPQWLLSIVSVVKTWGSLGYPREMFLENQTMRGRKQCGDAGVEALSAAPPHKLFIASLA